MDPSVENIKLDYILASRSWRCNNLKMCLSICDRINRDISKLPTEINESDQLRRLKQLNWFLKIRCLADDFYINESFLLNEDDIGGEDEVRIQSGSQREKNKSNKSSHLGQLSQTRARRTTGSAATRTRSGILSGRMPSATSRQNSGSLSSYRPLTTSLTATQTAFSNFTRPLLRYASCRFTSGPIYDYLYNAQTTNNMCPDYRQCLEYLNQVNNTLKASHVDPKDKISPAGDVHFNLTDEPVNSNLLGVFWLTAYGVCFFNLKMNKLAEDYFVKSLELNAYNVDCYTWLAKIYLRTNRIHEVLAICDKGITKTQNYILYNWKARAQSILGDIFSANLNLRKSLINYPNNLEALSNLGYFSFYCDKLEQSLRCYERIQMISEQQIANVDGDNAPLNDSSNLLNNLALCYFYNGYYHMVIPLFLKAFLNSPSREVTSVIWYNISFVPLSCGFTNIAIDCLKISLKNNSRNLESLNNLGVLKYGDLIDDNWRFQSELESRESSKKGSSSEVELVNYDDAPRYEKLFNEAETYFKVSDDISVDEKTIDSGHPIPEMLYNMALISKNRGNLQKSMQFCSAYMEVDSTSSSITRMMGEILDLISYET